MCTLWSSGINLAHWLCLSPPAVIAKAGTGTCSFHLFSLLPVCLHLPLPKLNVGPSSQMIWNVYNRTFNGLSAFNKGSSFSYYENEDPALAKRTAYLLARIFQQGRLIDC